MKGTKEQSQPRSDKRDIRIARGKTLKRTIMGPQPKPMSKRDLHVTLEPIVAAWLRATCKWDDVAIGDYRLVVFEFEPAPGTLLYIQFWSEPGETVLWEVSSGRWNPPADEWLAGDRSKRIEALGFEIGGKSENYVRDVTVESDGDVATVAKQVVRILYDAFEYRGTQPLQAKLTYEGRSELRPTYESFTPEDVAKIFLARGHKLREVDLGDDGEHAQLQCRRSGVLTTVELSDRLGDENLYQRITFSAELPATAEEAASLPPPQEGQVPVVFVSAVHRLGGGVTLQWLVERIAEWEFVTTMQLREVRREKRQVKKMFESKLNDVVH